MNNFLHYIVLPLKMVGCWEWYPNATSELQIIINDVYICFVLFVLTNMPIALIIHLYTEWKGVLDSLDKIADGLPLIVGQFIVTYMAIHKKDLYKLVDFMNGKFAFHSARGLTNMTMERSYETAKRFGYVYTACTLFSVSVYLILPIVMHLWTKLPIQQWFLAGITSRPIFVIGFLYQALAQAFLALSFGQLGVFYAANSILICGQLDLICCSLRNARYTALLHKGVPHAALAKEFEDILKDERHNYVYSKADMVDSEFHFDKQMLSRLQETRTQFDIYSEEFDEATSSALRDCAKLIRVVDEYKNLFERFVSPLLVLRVVQVTLYLCTLLYAATLKFDMVTVEYLGAVALDMFVYCYYGNQIIVQGDRVSTAAYQSLWHTMGSKPRRLLINILLSNKRPRVVRAGSFLPMNLGTYVVILKTSFSYYTLLVNVQDKKR